MTKQILVAVALMGAAFGASAASNPLDPSFARYNAALTFAAPAGKLEVTRTPLTPSFYQWNVVTAGDAQAPMIVANNPLQPSYKRS